jgi:glycosyltransferase involved in cell wall biosynthesis
MYLPEALDSAIMQMREDDELLVVDDGSTDNSVELLRQYEEQHGITLIRQENQGHMRAVRVGIDAAQGDIVVLLDSDDYFLDGYLSRLREIYIKYPEICLVLSNAQLEGDSSAGKRHMRHLLKRLELSPGRVGATKWATLLFNEFVGVPTSGISLRKLMAQKALDFPAALDETIALSPLLARLLGISVVDQRQFGFTPDGIIVRCASILDAQKYYNERPGFAYRIHGSNRFATTGRLGRWYLRRTRRVKFREMVKQHFSISSVPSATELREEILGRSLGKYRLRRVMVRGAYCCAILVSKGKLRQKLGALIAALGIQARHP